MSKTSGLAARLKEILDLPECPSSVLVLAPDEIRRERIISKVLGTFFKQQAPDRINLGDLSKDEFRSVSEDFGALSLFSQRRVFLLGRVDQAKAELVDLLLPVLKSQPTGTHLILNGTKLPSNSRLLKFFKDKDLALVLEDPSAVELGRWAEKELGGVGIKNSSPALLRGIVDLAMLQSERDSRPCCDAAYDIIERLSLFKDKEATVADLRALFPESDQVSEFVLIEALSKGEGTSADLMFRTLKASGVSEFMLLGLLAKTWSSYLAIADLKANGHSDPEIASALGINNWLYNKYLSGVRGQGIGKLRRNLWQVLRADSRLKNRSLQPENILGCLFSEIAS